MLEPFCPKSEACWFLYLKSHTFQGTKRCTFAEMLRNDVTLTPRDCTHTNVQVFKICKRFVTRLLSSWYQDVFALLVPSCCDKSGTSCYHLVTRLMTVTDLLQVVPTRLIQAVRNKLLRACCHQLVNNLLRADDIRLVGTTCCESVGLINLVTRW